MPHREYEITIAADGTVELKVSGHPGKSCLDVARMFEEIVGKQTEQKLTAEFYEPDDEVRNQIDQRY